MARCFIWAIMGAAKGFSKLENLLGREVLVEATLSASIEEESSVHVCKRRLFIYKLVIVISEAGVFQTLP